MFAKLHILLNIAAFKCSNFIPKDLLPEAIGMFTSWFDDI